MKMKDKKKKKIQENPKRIMNAVNTKFDHHSVVEHKTYIASKHKLTAISQTAQFKQHHVWPVPKRVTTWEYQVNLDMQVV